MSKITFLNLRIIFILFSFILSLQVEAQEVSLNNLASLKPGAKINFEIDFSNSIIMGMNETDFSKYEKDWEKDKPSIVSKLLKGINNKLNGIFVVGTYNDSPYILKIVVKNISDVGNIFCDANILDKDNQTIFQVKNVNGGAEPPFLPGTKLAKIKIWAALIGNSLGGILKNEYLEQ